MHPFLRLPPSQPKGSDMTANTGNSCALRNKACYFQTKCRTISFYKYFQKMSQDQASKSKV